MAQQKRMQNMKILKSRIIMTDELIGKYKDKVQEYEKSKEQISELCSQLQSLQRCIHGLKREMDSLYQEKEKIRSDWESSMQEKEELKKENESLRWGLLSEEQMNRTLMGELREAQYKQQENTELHTANKELTVDRDKWKERCQKLRQEKEKLRSGSRRGSTSHFDASLLPTPLTSPPSSMGSVDHMDLHFSSDSEAEDMVEVNKLSAVLSSSKGEVPGETASTLLNRRLRPRRSGTMLPRVPSSASLSSRSLSPLAPFSPAPDSPKLSCSPSESPINCPSPAVESLEETSTCPPSQLPPATIPAVGGSVVRHTSSPATVTCRTLNTTRIYSTRACGSPVTAAVNPVVACHDSVPIDSPSVHDSVPVVSRSSVKCRSASISTCSRPSVACHDSASISGGSRPSVACHDSPSIHRGSLPPVARHNSPSVPTGSHPSVARHDSDCSPSPVPASVTVNQSQCEAMSVDHCDDDSDEELEFIFSQFRSLNVLSPLPPSPVLSSSSSFVDPFSRTRSPTLSPLPNSPVSLRSSLSPLPSSPNMAASLSPLPQSPQIARASSPLQPLPTIDSSAVPHPTSVAPSLSPLPLSPSVSPVSPLQRAPSKVGSLSPLPLSPAVSPLSPLEQPPSVTPSLSPIPPSPAVAPLSPLQQQPSNDTETQLSAAISELHPAQLPSNDAETQLSAAISEMLPAQLPSNDEMQQSAATSEILPAQELSSALSSHFHTLTSQEKSSLPSTAAGLPGAMPDEPASVCKSHCGTTESPDPIVSVLSGSSPLDHKPLSLPSRDSSSAIASAVHSPSVADSPPLVDALPAFSDSAALPNSRADCQCVASPSTKPLSVDAASVVESVPSEDSLEDISPTMNSPVKSSSTVKSFPTGDFSIIPEAHSPPRTSTDSPPLEVPTSSPSPLQCRPFAAIPLPSAQYSLPRDSEQKAQPMECHTPSQATSSLPLMHDNAFEMEELPVVKSEPASSECISPPQSPARLPVTTPSKQSPGTPTLKDSFSSPLPPSPSNLRIELFGSEEETDHATTQLPFADLTSNDQGIPAIPAVSNLDDNSVDSVQSGVKKRHLSPEKSLASNKVKKRRQLVDYSDCPVIGRAPRDDVSSVRRIRTRSNGLRNLTKKTPFDKKLTQKDGSQGTSQSRTGCDEVLSGVSGSSGGCEDPDVQKSAASDSRGANGCGVLEVKSVSSGRCGPLPGSRCGYGVPMDMPTHQCLPDPAALPWNDEGECAPQKSRGQSRRGRRGSGKRCRRGAPSNRIQSVNNTGKNHCSSMGLQSQVKSEAEVSPQTCTDEQRSMNDIGPMEELLSGDIAKSTTKSECKTTSSEIKSQGDLVPPSKVPLAPSPDLSVAQQSLCASMQCPLPLPLWLVSAMLDVQSKQEHCVLRHWGIKKKKKGPRIKGPITEPFFRKTAQQPQHFVFSNLELLASGQLHLSAIITMFTDTASVPTSNAVTAGLIQFFLEVYNPDIEHVMSLFRGQCKKLSLAPVTADPLDPYFVPALLRPECQIVALLAHMCRLSPVMTNLLQEACWALQQAVMKHGLNFHKLLAMSRVFAALIRLQADSERLLFFIAELLKKPILPNEMYVIMGVGSIWPSPPCRKKSPPLQKLRTVNLKVLEGAMLRTTLEVAVLHKYRVEGVKAGVHEAFVKNLQTYYGWDSSLPADRLAESLLQILQTSSNVSIDLSPMSLTPWQRPRPSVVAYQVVYCLNVLAACKRWSWTNDFLIGKHLWPILQEWSGKKGSLKGQCEEEEGVAIKDAVVVCVLRLIGFLCSFGVKEDPASTSMEQLRRVMMALLKEASSSSHITLSMQLATVDSLMEMTPPKHASRQQVVGVVKVWLRNQESQHWFYPLQTELHQRFQLTL